LANVEFLGSSGGKVVSVNVVYLFLKPSSVMSWVHRASLWTCGFNPCDNSKEWPFGS